MSVSLLLVLATLLNASVLPTEYPAGSYTPGGSFGAYWWFDVETYQPSDVDMDDLNHSYYYTWGIEMPGASEYPDGYTITQAELVFTNIYNYTASDPCNILFVHLLDDAPLDLTQGYDGQGGGDAFAGEELIGEWRHNPGGAANMVDLVFHFDSALLTQANIHAFDGILGLGIDPDCHYFNDGVTFAIEIEAFHEPEPTTLCLFGLAGAMILKKRKRTG